MESGIHVVVVFVVDCRVQVIASVYFVDDDDVDDGKQMGQEGDDPLVDLREMNLTDSRKMEDSILNSIQRQNPMGFFYI